jgi:hypothetical protein
LTPTPPLPQRARTHAHTLPHAAGAAGAVCGLGALRPRSARRLTLPVHPHFIMRAPRRPIVYKHAMSDAPPLGRTTRPLRGRGAPRECRAPVVPANGAYDSPPPKKLKLLAPPADAQSKVAVQRASNHQGGTGALQPIESRSRAWLCRPRRECGKKGGYDHGLDWIGLAQEAGPDGCRRAVGDITGGGQRRGRVGRQ